MLHGKRCVFLESDEDGEPPTEEKEADTFAADLLIPPSDVKVLLSRPWRKKAEVREFAGELGIAPGIVVGRLQHEGILPHSHFNDLKVRIAHRPPSRTREPHA